MYDLLLSLAFLFDVLPLKLWNLFTIIYLQVSAQEFLDCLAVGLAFFLVGDAVDVFFSKKNFQIAQRSSLSERGS